MQAEASAEQMAGGSRLHHREPDQHRQDRHPGPEEEKAHIHRGERKRRAGEPLPQVSQAIRAGDQLPGGDSAAGKGGGQGLVLQPQAEREAHDAAWTSTHPGGRVLTGGQHGSRHTVTLHRLQEDVQRHVKITKNRTRNPSNVKCLNTFLEETMSCFPEGEDR